VADRTVHARWVEDGHYVEAVRYDRSGKWYIEPQGRLGDFTGCGSRRQVKIKEAVEQAVRARASGSVYAVILFGEPGGSRFDKLVNDRMRALGGN